MARSNAVGRLREIIESEGDPKEALLAAVAKQIPDDMVTRCQVLVATHPGHKYHPGTRLLRTDQDLKEQQYQANIGLVVKLGPGAFIDAPGAAFYGVRAEVGDWVLMRPADGLSMLINQVPCRLFEDAGILMVVKNPELYW